MKVEESAVEKHVDRVHAVKLGSVDAQKVIADSVKLVNALVHAT